MNNPRLSTMNGTTVSDQAATSRLLNEINAVARFAKGPAIATSIAWPGPYGLRVRMCPAQTSSTIGCTGTPSANDITTWPASWIATAAARQPHHNRAVFAPSAIVPGLNSPSARRMTRRPISRYGHDWPTEIGILPRRATVNGLPAGDVSMITGDSSSSHMIPDRRAERDAAGGRAAELAQPGSAAERGVDRGLAIAQDRLAPGDEVVGHLDPRRDLAERTVAPRVRAGRLHGLVAHADRVEPDRAAGRERPWHVVALGDQRGAGDAEDPDRPYARVVRVESGVVGDDLRIGHASANEVAPHRVRLVVVHVAVVAGDEDDLDLAGLPEVVRDVEAGLQEVRRRLVRQHLGPEHQGHITYGHCLLYTSPSPRDRTRSRMPS